MPTARQLLDDFHAMRTWIREQLDIDEARAQAAPDGDLEAARLLRLVAAKRRVLSRITEEVSGPWEDLQHDDDLLSVLCADYSERPGFRESWRP